MVSKRNWLAPRVVVGLATGPRSVCAVQAVNTLKGVLVKHAAVKDLENPDDLPQAIKTLLQGMDLKHDFVVTSLPGSSAFVRNVVVPFRKTSKLEKIIKYQLEPYLPRPVDEMEVDFLSPDPEGSAVVAAAPTATISEHLARMAEAGIEPDLVTLDAVALLTLYRHIPEKTRPETVGVIYATQDHAIVQVIHRDRLDFVRILPGGLADPEIISETFGLYGLKRPGVRVEEVLVVDDTPGGEALSLGLGEKLNRKVRDWRPLDHLRHELGSGETALQRRLCVGVGVALTGLSRGAKTIDLRKHISRVSSAVDLRKTLRLTLFLAAVLVVLLTVGLYQKLHDQARRYDRLNEQVTDILATTFPGIPHIVKGQEVHQMQQKVEEVSKRYAWLGELSGRGPVLEILKTLSVTLSAFPDVQVDMLAVDEMEIRIDGRASSFETVDRLKERLSVSGFFESVQLAGAKADRKENVVQFAFGMVKK
jgi:type II secretory pathway component PulL